MNARKRHKLRNKARRARNNAIERTFGDAPDAYGLRTARDFRKFVNVAKAVERGKLEWWQHMGWV